MKKLSFLLSITTLLIVSHELCADTIISGKDKKVHKTVIAAANNWKDVVVFWTSESLKNHKGRVSLYFNRSLNDGRKWRNKPFSFCGNAKSAWIHDLLPKLCFDNSGQLHMAWIQADNKTSPRYSATKDFGDNWSPPQMIGVKTSTYKSGVTLGIENVDDSKKIWSMYDDGKLYATFSEKTPQAEGWENADFKIGYTYKSPGISLYAVQRGKYRYVLRLLSGRNLVLLVYNGKAWSGHKVYSGRDRLSMAENHSFAVDSDGVIYVAYSDRGKLYCRSSRDNGRKWDKVQLPSVKGMQKVPVVGVTPKGMIYIVFQVDWNGIKTEKKISSIAYCKSIDKGKIWAEIEMLPNEGTIQKSPDMITSGERMLISYTQDKQAIFSAVPVFKKKVIAKNKKGNNLLKNGTFDLFDSNLPKDWKFKSRNNKSTKVTFGPGQGRNGQGKSFKINDSLDMTIAQFDSPTTEITPDTDYVFKGYYKTNGNKVKVTGSWLDKNRKNINTFIIKLPETQGYWCPFFDEVMAPAKGKYLALKISRRWDGSSVSFDDFSLREGFLRDYISEFQPQFTSGKQPVFPIFGWIPPYYSRRYKDKAELFNSDKMHAEYAMCNFTINGRAIFGVKELLRPSCTPEQMIAANKNPGVWGFHGKDEPREKLFPQCLKNKITIAKYAPTKQFFNNLLPVYGFSSMDVYRKHIQKYIYNIKPTILTYDYYGLSSKKGLENKYSKNFYANMELIREECLKAKCKYGLIAQVVAFGKCRSPNDAELRWQAFSSLAYGGKIHGWFTFLTEYQPSFNWHDAVIDLEGFRTRHYSMLRRLNAEIILLGRHLLKLKSSAVYHSKLLPNGTKDIDDSELLKIKGKGEWILGEFDKTKDHLTYFMLVNRDFVNNGKGEITFKNPITYLFEIDKRNGDMRKVDSFDLKSNSLTLNFSPGEGKLFVIKE
jgi:hypothetical protein